MAQCCRNRPRPGLTIDISRAESSGTAGPVLAHRTYTTQTDKTENDICTSYYECVFILFIKYIASSFNAMSLYVNVRATSVLKCIEY